MADLTPPSPADIAPGWAGVVLSGLLVLVLKPVGIAVAKAAGRLLASIGVQWDLGARHQREREQQTARRIAELEQDLREERAVVTALTADVAMLRERVAARDQDVRERDREIARLRRDLTLAHQQRRDRSE